MVSTKNIEGYKCHSAFLSLVSVSPIKNHIRYIEKLVRATKHQGEITLYPHYLTKSCTTPISHIALSGQSNE